MKKFNADKSQDKISPLLKGLSSSLFIIFVGFGVMNIFWLYDPQTSERGLYYYKAATIGDALFLPLLIGATVILIEYGPKLSKRQNTISIIFGALAAIIAILIQAEWLINPNTKPNWTIPRAHFFTAAGWYHAVFFVFMFFIISTQTARVWFSRKISNNDNTIRTFCTMLMLLGGSGFVFMITLDNYSEPAHYIFPLFKSLLIYACLSSFYLITSAKDNWNNDYIAILSGVSVTFCFAFILMSSAQPLYILSISAFLFSAAFISPRSSSISNMFMNYVMVGLPVFFVSTALSILPDSSLLILGTSFLTCNAIPFLTAKNQFKYLDETRDPLFFGLIFNLFTSLAIVLMVIHIDENGFKHFSELIFIFLFGIFCRSYINRTFKHVTNDEENSELPKTQLIVYSLISSVLFGGLFFLIQTQSYKLAHLTDSPVLFPVWTPEATIIALILSATIIILFVFAFFLPLQKISYRFENIYKTSIVALTAILFITLTMLLYIIRGPFDEKTWHLIFIFPIIGSAALTGYGFYANMITIRGHKNDIHYSILGIIIFIGSIFCVTFSALPPQHEIGQNTDQITLSSNIIFTTIGFIGIGVSNVLTTYILGNITILPAIKPSLAGNTPVSGSCQDGLVGSLLVLCAVIIPLHCSFVDHDTFAILITIPLSIGLAWIFFYCTRLNVKHLYKKMKTEKGKNEHEKAILLNKKQKLCLHLRNQNIISLISLVPYSLIFTLDKISQSDKSIKEAYEDFAKDHIPNANHFKNIF